MIGCNFIIYFIINFPYYLTYCRLIARFYSLLIFYIYFREQNENLITSANLTEKKSKAQSLSQGHCWQRQTFAHFSNCRRQKGEKGESSYWIGCRTVGGCLVSTQIRNGDCRGLGLSRESFCSLTFLLLVQAQLQFTHVRRTQETFDFSFRLLVSFPSFV